MVDFGGIPDLLSWSVGDLLPWSKMGWGKGVKKVDFVLGGQ